jgi:hypothetical protein
MSLRNLISAPAYTLDPVFLNRQFVKASWQKLPKILEPWHEAVPVALDYVSEGDVIQLPGSEGTVVTLVERLPIGYEHFPRKVTCPYRNKTFQRSSGIIYLALLHYRYEARDRLTTIRKLEENKVLYKPNPDYTSWILHRYSSSSYSHEGKWQGRSNLLSSKKSKPQKEVVDYDLLIEQSTGEAWEVVIMSSADKRPRVKGLWVEATSGSRGPKEYFIWEYAGKLAPDDREFMAVSETDDYLRGLYERREVVARGVFPRAGASEITIGTLKYMHRLCQDKLRNRTEPLEHFVLAWNHKRSSTDASPENVLLNKSYGFEKSLGKLSKETTWAWSL